MILAKTCSQCGAQILDADIHNRWHRNQAQAIEDAAKVPCKRCKGTGKQPGLHNACGRCWGSRVER